MEILWLLALFLGIIISLSALGCLVLAGWLVLVAFVIPRLPGTTDSNRVGDRLKAWRTAGEVLGFGVVTDYARVDVRRPRPQAETSGLARDARRS